MTQAEKRFKVGACSAISAEKIESELRDRLAYADWDHFIAKQL